MLLLQNVVKIFYKFMKQNITKRLVKLQCCLLSHTALCDQVVKSSFNRFKGLPCPTLFMLRTKCSYP